MINSNQDHRAAVLQIEAKRDRQMRLVASLQVKALTPAARGGGVKALTPPRARATRPSIRG
jgi:hypothetical protein